MNKCAVCGRAWKTTEAMPSELIGMNVLGLIDCPNCYNWYVFNEMFRKCGRNKILFDIVLKNLGMRAERN
jgi:hypothetical protein